MKQKIEVLNQNRVGSTHSATVRVAFETTTTLGMSGSADKQIVKQALIENAVREFARDNAIEI